MIKPDDRADRVLRRLAAEPYGAPIAELLHDTGLLRPSLSLVLGRLQGYGLVTHVKRGQNDYIWCLTTTGRRSAE